jgi:hypothetical protein
MKKVFNNINDVSKLFIAQSQDFAGTPYVYIQGQGKGRRFYFKGDTIYSYRDSYPLAKIKGNSLYIKEENYSKTTSKHKCSLLRFCNSLHVIKSNDLVTPNSGNPYIEKMLNKIFNSKKYSYENSQYLLSFINLNLQPITESKFPLLFDKKHEKLKQMFFSKDKEIFNLAKKIIKQQKLI